MKELGKVVKRRVVYWRGYQCGQKRMNGGVKVEMKRGSHLIPYFQTSKTRLSLQETLIKLRKILIRGA